MGPQWKTISKVSKKINLSYETIIKILKRYCTENEDYIVEVGIHHSRYYVNKNSIAKVMQMKLNFGYNAKVKQRIKYLYGERKK